MRVKDEMWRICKIAHDRYPGKHIDISATATCYDHSKKTRFEWEYGLYVEEKISHEKFKSLRGMKAFLDAKLIDDEGEA